ncbi:hypothetical protein HYU13_05640 [Candidatus Woesearchaeota archaeon]|nr:hypothetical protein [Candidatus Woesearchaeota archaeon]
MNFRAWNATIYGEVCPPIPGANSTNPPVLSSFNCTSCDIPNGDNSTPYSTLDTTPAFTFTTDKNAWCRIDDEDLNFTGMGALRNCTSGDGSLAHTCNLLPEDALEYKSTDYLYISCRDSANVESSASSSGPLEMEMINSASQANTAIERGINASNASAAIFNDQQVFIRSLNNSQAMATFDRVAIYKSQKWAFNYISTNETAIGQFYNLSPAFYFWEGMNLSDIQITDQVGKLINKTKI